MADLVLSLMASGKRALAITGVAADTLDLTDTSKWMPLEGVGGFDVYAEADSGQTITAAPNPICYIRNPHTGRVARAQAMDITGQTVTGVRTVYLGSFAVTADTGRIAYQNSGGTVSSGNLTIQIVPCGKLGAGELL